MTPKHLGKIVLQRREQLGVSQQVVCEGLCTAMTLSRFEKGRQTLSRDCVMAILQRLGLPDDQYYAQLTRRETRLVLLRKEILTCCGQFEQASESSLQQTYTKAWKKLRELESYIKKSDCINQQFILGVKATLGTIVGPYSFEEQREMLIKSLQLTSPRFSLDAIDNCLYSTNEVAIINKIAVSYSRNGQRRKAIDIYNQLIKFLQKRVPSHSYLPLIAHNYAQYLGFENRLEESLEISELGRQLCVQKGQYYLLPRFLHIEAIIYHAMGEIDRSKDRYRSAYYIYEATMDKKSQELLRIKAKEQVNLVL